MKANPLGRVLAAKPPAFVGLALLVAVAALRILSARLRTTPRWER
jgi:hypothetical protein